MYSLRIRQCTTSSFTPSTFVLSNCQCWAAFFSDATCINAACSRALYRRLLRDFLLRGKTGQLGPLLEKNDGSATILEFCIRETWCRGNCCTTKSLWTLLMKTKRTRSEKSGRACLQRCKGLSFYIVDVWTATGIRVAPGQQAIIRSLETYWNDNKDKLDTGRGTG